MNHIDVMGNLVKDVEVRFTSNQKAIALFTIAENRYNFKTKENFEFCERKRPKEKKEKDA